MKGVRNLDLAGIIEPMAPVDVVDVGASPIDGPPPYKNLLDRGLMRLVGFEPQEDALKQLNAAKGPYETYLPDAVGDGRPIYCPLRRLAPKQGRQNRLMHGPGWR